jgi:hypothetical protein
MSEYIRHPVLGHIAKCCDTPDIHGHTDPETENSTNEFFIVCANCNTKIVDRVNKEISLKNFIEYIVSQWNRSARDAQQKEYLKRRREQEQNNVEQQISFIRKIGTSHDKPD